MTTPTQAADGGGAAALYARKYHDARAEIASLRVVNAQVVYALRGVTEMLNAARLIMTDDEARRMAGEAVNTAREIIRAAS